MASAENISVYVRVRPLNEQERTAGAAWRVQGNEVFAADPATGVRAPDAATYQVDAVFDGDQTTSQVYERTAQGLVECVLDGINGTLFAYGQTSSGKTHTMKGTGSWAAGQADPNGAAGAAARSGRDAEQGAAGGDEAAGIIPRAVHETFRRVAQAPDREFLVRVSYMELYNEQIVDLLGAAGPGAPRGRPGDQKLEIHETKEAGVHVVGLREHIVGSPEQVLALLETGEAHRHFGETKMNKNSSRSHTIFRMVVESRTRAAEPAAGTTAGACVSATGGGTGAAGADQGGTDLAVRVSTLTLVDLAGSERISKTGAVGQRRKEGAAINKSLLTLGTVINKLSEGVQAAGGHIPYRDSKLTRILQPSLGGNARTAVICAVTPAATHAEETANTLRFACRAKCVVNKASVNEVLSDAAVLRRQAKEIEELRRMLQGQSNTEDIEKEIQRLRAELLAKEQDNERMQLELAAEQAERARAQKKVEHMKRIMLQPKGGSRTSGPGDASGSGGLCAEESTAVVAQKLTRAVSWSPSARRRPSVTVGRGKVVLVPEHAKAMPGSRKNSGGSSTSGLSSAGGSTHRLSKPGGSDALQRWSSRKLSQEHSNASEAGHSSRSSLIPAGSDASKCSSSGGSGLPVPNNSEIEAVVECMRRAQEHGALGTQAQLNPGVLLRQHTAPAHVTGSWRVAELGAPQQWLQQAQQWQQQALAAAIPGCAQPESGAEIEGSGGLGMPEQSCANPMFEDHGILARSSSEAEEQGRKHPTLYHIKAVIEKAQDWEAKAAEAAEALAHTRAAHEAALWDAQEEGRQRLAALRAELDQALKELRAARAALADRDATIAGLRQEAQASADAMQAQLARARAATKQHEEAHAQQQETAAGLRREVSRLTDALAAAQAGLAVEQKRGGAGGEALREAAAQLLACQRQCERLAGAKVALEQRNSELAAKAAAAVGAVFSTEELKELKARHKEEVAQLTGQAKAAAAATAAAEKTAQRLQAENEKLRAKVQEAETKLHAAVQDRSKTQLEKAQLERELAGLRHTARQAPGDRPSPRAGASRFGSTSGEKQQPAKAKESLHKARADLLAKQEECTALQRQVGAARMALGPLEEERDRLIRQLKAAEESQSAISAIQHLRFQLAAKEQELVAATAGKAALQEQLEERRKHVELLQGQLSEAQAKNAALLADLAAFQANQLVLQKQRDDLEAEGEALRASLDESSQQVSRLQGEIIDAVAEIMEMKSQLAHLEQQCIELEANGQVVRASLEQAHAELAAVHRREEAAQATARAAPQQQEAGSAAGAEADAARGAAAAALRSKLDHALADRAQAQAALSAARGSLESMRAEARRAAAAAAQHAEAYERLRQAEPARAAEVAELRARLAAMEQAQSAAVLRSGEQQIRTLEEAKARLEQVHMQHEAAVAVLQSTRAALEGRLAVAQQEATALAEGQEAALKATAGLRRELERGQAELASALAALAAERNRATPAADTAADELAALHAHLQQEEAARTAEVATLKARLVEEETQATTLAVLAEEQAGGAALQEQLHVLRSQLAAAQAEAARAVAASSQLASEREALEAKAAAAATLEGRLAEAEQRCVQLEVDGDLARVSLKQIRTDLADALQREEQAQSVASALDELLQRNARRASLLASRLAAAEDAEQRAEQLAEQLDERTVDKEQERNPTSAVTAAGAVVHEAQQPGGVSGAEPSLQHSLDEAKRHKMEADQALEEARRRVLELEAQCVELEADGHLVRASLEQAHADLAAAAGRRQLAQMVAAACSSSDQETSHRREARLSARLSAHLAAVEVATVQAEECQAELAAQLEERCAELQDAKDTILHLERLLAGKEEELAGAAPDSMAGRATEPADRTSVAAVVQMQERLLATQQELADAGAALQRESVAAKSRQHELAEQTRALQHMLEDLGQEKAGAERALQEAHRRIKALEHTAGEHAERSSMLHGQIRSVEARCAELEVALEQAHADLAAALSGYVHGIPLQRMAQLAADEVAAAQAGKREAGLTSELDALQLQMRYQQLVHERESALHEREQQLQEAVELADQWRLRAEGLHDKRAEAEQQLGAAKADLRSKLEALLALRASLDSKPENLDTATSTSAALEQTQDEPTTAGGMPQGDELKQQMAALSAQLAAEAAATEQERTQVVEELAASQATLAAAQSSLEAMRSTAAAAEAAAAARQDDVAVLTAQVEEARHDAAVHTEQLAVLSAAKGAAEAEATELRASLETAKAEVAEAQAAAQATSRLAHAEVGAAQQQLEELTAAVREHAAAEASLKSNLAAALQQVQSLTVEKAAAKEAAAALEIELELAQGDASNARSELAAARCTHDQAVSEAGRAAGAVAAVQERLRQETAAHAAEKAALMAQLTRLEEAQDVQTAALEAWCAELEAGSHQAHAVLEQARSEHAATVAVLQREQVELCSQAEAAQAEAAWAVAQAAELDSARRLALESASALQQQLGEANAVAVSRDEEVAHLKAQLGQALVEARAADSALSAAAAGQQEAEAVAASLREEREGLAARLADTEELLTALRQQHTTMRQEHEEAAVELAVLREEAATLSAEKADAIATHQHSLQKAMSLAKQWQQSAEHLQSKQTQEEAAIQQLRAELAGRQREVLAASAAASDLEARCAELEADGHVARASLEQAHAELAGAQTAIQQLREELAGQRTERDIAHAARAALEQQLAAQSAELAAVQERLSAAVMQLQQEGSAADSRQRHLAQQTHVLQRQLSQAGREKLAAEEALAVATTSLEVREKEAREAAACRQQLEEQCAMLAEKGRELGTSLEQARPELAEASARSEHVAALNAQVGSLSTSLAEARDRQVAAEQLAVQQQEQQHQQLSAAVARSSALEGEVASLQLQLAAAREQLTTAGAATQAAMLDGKALHQECQELLRQREAAAKQHEQQLQAAIESTQKWQALAQGLQTKQGGAQEQLAQLQRELAQAQTEVAEAREATLAVEQRAAQAAEEHRTADAQHSAERDRLRKQVEELQASLAASASSTAEASAALGAERRTSALLTAAAAAVQEQLAADPLAAETAALRGAAAAADQRALASDLEHDALLRSMQVEIRELQAALLAAASVCDSQHGSAAQQAADTAAALEAAERDAAEVFRLRRELERLQRMVRHGDAEDGEGGGASGSGEGETDGRIRALYPSTAADHEELDQPGDAARGERKQKAVRFDNSPGGALPSERRSSLETKLALRSSLLDGKRSSAAGADLATAVSAEEAALAGIAPYRTLASSLEAELHAAAEHAAIGAASAALMAAPAVPQYGAAARHSGSLVERGTCMSRTNSGEVRGILRAPSGILCSTNSLSRASSAQLVRTSSNAVLTASGVRGVVGGLVELLRVGSDSGRQAAARALKSLAAGHSTPYKARGGRGAAAHASCNNRSRCLRPCRRAITEAAAIPPLVDLLQPGASSLFCQQEAAGALANLSCTDDVGPGLEMEQHGAVPLLAAMMQPGGSSAAREAAASAISNLACIRPCQAAVISAGAVPLLLALLQLGSSPGCQEAAARALANLLWGNLSDGTRAAELRIAAHRAIPLLVGIVSGGSDGARQAAARALSNIASRRALPPSSMLLLTCDSAAQGKIAWSTAPAALVALCQSPSDTLRKAAAVALWDIARASELGRNAVAAAGAIPRLTPLLLFGSSAVEEAAAGTLGELASVSAAVRQEITDAGAVPLLRQLARGDGAAAAAAATRALSSLGVRVGLEAGRPPSHSGERAPVRTAWRRLWTAGVDPAANSRPYCSMGRLSRFWETASSVMNTLLLSCAFVCVPFTFAVCRLIFNVDKRWQRDRKSERVRLHSRRWVTNALACDSQKRRKRVAEVWGRICHSICRRFRFGRGMPLDLGAWLRLMQRHARRYAEMKAEARQSILSLQEIDAMSSLTGSFVQDMVCAMCHARAAYGYTTGDGSVVREVVAWIWYRIRAIRASEAKAFPKKMRSNVVLSIAHVDQEDIIAAEWSGGIYNPCFYVAVDRHYKLIVVAIRGTASNLDMLTNATALPIEVTMEGRHGYVHEGIMTAAACIMPKVQAALIEAAARAPGLPVLVTGHSLGGGVAADLTVLLNMERNQVDAPLGRIRCIAFACPAVVCEEIAQTEAVKELVTSVVHGADVVPRFGHATMDALISEAASLSAVRRATSMVGRGMDALAKRLHRAQTRGTGASFSRLGMVPVQLYPAGALGWWHLHRRIGGRILWFVPSDRGHFVADCKLDWQAQHSTPPREARLCAEPRPWPWLQAVERLDEAFRASQWDSADLEERQGEAGEGEAEKGSEGYDSSDFSCYYDSLDLDAMPAAADALADGVATSGTAAEVAAAVAAAGAAAAGAAATSADQPASVARGALAADAVVANGQEEEGATANNRLEKVASDVLPRAAVAVKPVPAE
eukprot:scaffold4.g4977.t1